MKSNYKIFTAVFLSAIMTASSSVNSMRGGSFFGGRIFQ